MKKLFFLFFLLLTSALLFSENATFSLEGTWKGNVGDSMDWAYPSFDDTKWTDVTLPSANFLSVYSDDLFKDREPVQKTFIWFRKTFTLDAPPTYMVFLQIGEIQNADEVYLNGIRIGSTGSFPPFFRSGWREFRNYTIDQKLFREGKNTISMRVFCDVENWITGPIQLTTDRDSNFKKMMQDFWRINLFEYFFILLLWVSVYFLIYYVKRPHEIEYLYFSLTCIAMASVVLIWFFDVKYFFLPISSNAMYAFCQMALFFFPALLSLFVYTYLNKTVSLHRQILTLIGPVAGSVLLLFSMERSWLIYIRSFFLLLQPIFFVVMYSDMILALKRKKPRALQIVLSIVPLTLFSLRDMLAFILGIGMNGDAYFVYGIPPFFLLFSLQFIEQFVQTLNETETLKASFYRFVPVEFLKIIGRSNINDVRLGDSSHRELSVLFTDICQFTSISENMDAKDVFKLLNSYLSHMVPIIQIHNGFVDKYIGDAIMALFPKTPDDALLSAVSLRKALRSFNETQTTEGGVIISSGTGIHFGDLILGTIGGGDRMEGTVVSDAVNLASRIESLTRLYGCDILISGTVKELVNVPEHTLFRFIDRVSVKGRNSIVELYEVLWDIEDETIQPRVKTLGIFEQGISSYYSKNLDEAAIHFGAVLEQDPRDTVAELFLHRLTLIKDGKMEWNNHHAFNRK